jgi:hypothetical protein
MPHYQRMDCRFLKKYFAPLNFYLILFKCNHIRAGGRQDGDWVTPTGFPPCGPSLLKGNSYIKLLAELQKKKKKKKINILGAKGNRGTKDPQIVVPSTCTWSARGKVLHWAHGFLHLCKQGLALSVLPMVLVSVHKIPCLHHALGTGTPLGAQKFSFGTPKMLYLVHKLQRNRVISMKRQPAEPSPQ